MKSQADFGVDVRRQRDAPAARDGEARRRGISIWLDCSFETVQRRVLETAHRPLARDMVRFEQLYRSRLAAYGRADYRIAIHSDDPSAAVEVILALPLFA